MDTVMLDMVRRTEELLRDSEICAKETAKIRELEDKLTNPQMIISVIGQFKRGKSTLLNRMLGESLLPVGIVPVTSAVTRVEYGEKSAAVHFENGIIREVAFDELSEYISEQENPDNERGVSSVTLRTPAPFLKDGLILVDTPGVGSFHKHNSDAAYAFIKESDAVIFALSVDSPINEIEIDFLKNAKEYAAKFYFAVNKMDVVSEEDLNAYLDYCRRLLCRILEVKSVNMYAVSAKSGEGVSVLKDSIQRDCKAASEKIIQESVAMKLKDSITVALAQLGLYWNALKMPTGRFDDRFKSMEEYLEDVKESGERMHIRLEGIAEDFILESKNAFASYELNLTAMEAEAQQELQRKIYSDQNQKIEDLCWEMANEMEAGLNETKHALSDLVAELFGMEYHYETKVLDLRRDREDAPLAAFEALADQAQRQEGFAAFFEKIISNYTLRLKQLVEELSGKFRSEVEQTCAELRAELNHILMYRETSTYVVARKIEDLNILTRELKKIKNQLQ